MGGRSHPPAGESARYLALAGGRKPVHGVWLSAGIIFEGYLDDGAAADQAKLAFQHVGDMYFLSKIETPGGVYTIGTPRVMTKVAQTRDEGTMSSSGTN